MDKILAFSILSSSPADISASGFSTQLSWRTPSAGSQKQQQLQRQAEQAPKQQEGKAAEQRGPRPAAAERKARFAPEFDGINCFESIVSS
ncbi:hypothetical protein PAHAL_4G338200 [Panicum hallii]|jgi:TfoX/Sxy family transcriptional regulator of competence genes|uniref:Uncharacterized protein n=1 Tax=Panicum hallii TaxID=206008 RepID=A0A2S3HMK9_9POAL|nr:uncharacterized protein LOC112891003 [Panicum hallii]PAN25973.1 hypothetical protein PAHAL_4G338200 [Panicum hallii]